VNSDELSVLYSQARALLFPSEEDFGIVPLEAQASGIPVIAFGKGGVLETVLEGETGLFFKSQTTNDILDSIIQFENMNFNKKLIRDWVKKFSGTNFINGIRDFVFSV